MGVVVSWYMYTDILTISINFPDRDLLYLERISYKVCFAEPAHRDIGHCTITACYNRPIATIPCSRIRLPNAVATKSPSQ